jgi:hypothetical protein
MHAIMAFTINCGIASVAGSNQISYLPSYGLHRQGWHRDYAESNHNQSSITQDAVHSCKPSRGLSTPAIQSRGHKAKYFHFIVGIQFNSTYSRKSEFRLIRPLMDLVVDFHSLQLLPQSSLLLKSLFHLSSLPMKSCWRSVLHCSCRHYCILKSINNSSHSRAFFDAGAHYCFI